jgi:hypothetical protein
LGGPEVTSIDILSKALKRTLVIADPPVKLAETPTTIPVADPF